MTNLLKLFKETSNEERSRAGEEKLQEHQLRTDLKKILQNFKNIKTELQLQSPQDQLLINRVNEGIENTESLLLSMGVNVVLDEPHQAGVGVRP